MSSGNRAARDTKIARIPTTLQRVSCVALHPVVFASLIAVIAPGITALNIYNPRQIPTIAPADRAIAILFYHIPHINVVL